MNVVPFYLAVGAVLAGIYVFFKPLNVEIDAPEELAQLELTAFTVHEVVPSGVKTILRGKKAYRFEDRYEIEDINLTDRSEGYRKSMRADSGVYRQGIITLEGQVLFHRSDGIFFRTSRAVYDQNESTVATVGEFLLWRGGDRMKGRDLYYNLKSGDITAKAVDGIYRIEKEQM